jgi:protease II
MTVQEEVIKYLEERLFDLTTKEGKELYFLIQKFKKEQPERAQWQRIIPENEDKFIENEDKFIDVHNMLK